MINNHYLVAGANQWTRRAFDKIISGYEGVWKFISGPAELSPVLLGNFAPRYIFFLHWSWKVPSDIARNYECVCFHMTDVPYGRGGTPLQNLILRGHQRTRLSALRMIEELDAGPVYLKEDLELAGSAEEIYERASGLSAQMIQRIIVEEPVPQPQVGEPTIFVRRKSQESQIPLLGSLEALYDFVRMLDAPGYPHAFINFAGFHYELTNARIESGRMVASVQITPIATSGE